MKIVKPMRLGVVPTVFMNQRTPHLLVTTFVGFSYDRPARLLDEPSVWKNAHAANRPAARALPVGAGAGVGVAHTAGSAVAHPVRRRLRRRRAGALR
ncbi:hypothetical protein WME79_36770 [Sorangium sp. So ce726]|uniref:hypothetical protein n=1 Tax=Sorangium sp. So ce726 TaxID=3133319 RepID=UPI003F619942